MPSLLEKFTDSKILVRSANMKVLRKIMGVCPPRTVLDLLSVGMSHQSWRVREEVVNTHILVRWPGGGSRAAAAPLPAAVAWDSWMEPPPPDTCACGEQVMLQFSKDAYDRQKVFRLLLAGLNDGKDAKVRLVALEGLAVMASKLGASELQSLMRQAAVPDAVKAQVQQRLTNPALATVNADGMVEHAVDMPSTSEGYEPTLALAAGESLPAAPGVAWWLLQGWHVRT